MRNLLNHHYLNAILFLGEKTKKSTLKCGLKNDRFTVNDSQTGNGALTYPVGLLTVDEASMAGLLFGNSNTLNFLYTNQNNRLMSPYGHH
ncbi:MAG: hypothetical protein PHF21_03410 [Bacilli bacterium]|nr:hypothetical protein [Bacilli bacterium]